MNLLAVERIKLFSTRSPWGCAVLAIVLTVGFSALFMAPGEDIEVFQTQNAYQFGLAVVMVLAALTITTEYRFGTIRSTFQAVPQRTPALLAKTAVVSLTAGIIGLVCGFGAWGLSTLLKPTANLALDSAQEWRNVAGLGPVFALTAIISIAVGIMIRHTAGTITLLLIEMMLVESLFVALGDTGKDIHKWLPFSGMANRFLFAGSRPDGAEAAQASVSTLDPWWALAYLAAIAAVLLTTAIVTAKRRDA